MSPVVSLIRAVFPMPQVRYYMERRLQIKPEGIQIVRKAEVQMQKDSVCLKTNARHPSVSWDDNLHVLAFWKRTRYYFEGQLYRLTKEQFGRHAASHTYPVGNGSRLPCVCLSRTAACPAASSRELASDHPRAQSCQVSAYCPKKHISSSATQEPASRSVVSRIPIIGAEAAKDCGLPVCMNSARQWVAFSVMHCCHMFCGGNIDQSWTRLCPATARSVTECATASPHLRSFATPPPPLGQPALWFNRCAGPAKLPPDNVFSPPLTCSIFLPIANLDALQN